MQCFFVPSGTRAMMSLDSRCLGPWDSCLFPSVCFHGGLHALDIFLPSQSESKISECALKTEILHKRMAVLFDIVVTSAWKSETGGS